MPVIERSPAVLMRSCCTCLRFSKQSLHTLCGACVAIWLSAMLFFEQSEQMHHPQLRQWWRRREKPKERLQDMHSFAALSGIQPGSSPPATDAKDDDLNTAATASRDGCESDDWLVSKLAG